MNINTGELMMLRAEQAKLLEKEIEGFVKVPTELEEEAIKALDGKEKTIVDLESDTPLANWARQERKHKTKSSRAKMAKASKRKNRGK